MTTAHNNPAQLNEAPSAESLHCTTLSELLQQRAHRHGDKVAFTFLLDGDSKESCVTYAQLDGQACAIAARLQMLGATGSRALLLYTEGLEYIAAFFGCLYAGVVAVPLALPRPNRPLERLEATVAEAQPTLALTTEALLTGLKERMEPNPVLRRLNWLATDSTCRIQEAEWIDTGATSETLAFLQYTSGSTAAPKGVMVSHGNLMHNLNLIQNGFENTFNSKGVFWLPFYHDMGLIGGLLETVYCGASTTLMSPVSFLQRPMRWLQAISRTRATVSGGPNFAFDLCVQKTTPEQRATLDLSCWEVAFNGAEPIYAETLHRFAEAFAPCGFRYDAFYPCYGLAEATLIATGGTKAAPPKIQGFDAAALELNQVRAVDTETSGQRLIVGCGTSAEDQTLVIVNPERNQECASDEIGEIWLAGDSIALGYWQRPLETEQTFDALLVESGQGQFMRTGDLGFLFRGELFVCGRLKDLIIINGRNHYPEDIERTVEASHPALKLDSSAVFGINASAPQTNDARSVPVESVVVVQEVERQHRNTDMNTVVVAIRQAVVEQHDVRVAAIVLLKPGGLPRTSSGKVQRRACRDLFLSDSLPKLHHWPAPAVQEPSEQPTE